MVQRLILSIEHKRISFPNIPTLLKEPRTFTYEVTKTGKISYGASPGQHDDTVIAIALANLYREKNGSDDYEVKVIDMVLEFNESVGCPRSFREFMFSDDD